MFEFSKYLKTICKGGKKMGKEKHKKPEQLKVNADNERLYDEMTEAKEIAEEYSPNKKTR